MQVIHLLGHEDNTVVLIPLILVYGLGCLLICLFDFIKDLLELVEVEAAPDLQLHMITIRYV